MKTFANIISIIFQPIFIPLMGILLLMQNSSFGQNYSINQRLIIYGGIFLFTGFIPAFVVIIGMLNGKISDGFISERQQRITPYLISILSYCLCCAFVIYEGLGLWVGLLMMGATISLLMISIINFFWKISAHMAGIGGLCGGVFACSIGFQSNPIALICVLIIISGLVGYSRLYLKAHNLAQVTAGYALGFICVFSPYFFLYNMI